MTDKNAEVTAGPRLPDRVTDWPPEVRAALEARIAQEVEKAGQSGVLAGLNRIKPHIDTIREENDAENTLRVEFLKTELEQVGRVVLLAAGIGGVVLPLVISQVVNVDLLWMRAAAYAFGITIVVGLVRQAAARHRTEAEVAAQNTYAEALSRALSGAVLKSELDAIREMGPIARARLERQAKAKRLQAWGMLAWDVCMYGPLVSGLLFLVWSLPSGVAR